MAEHTFEELSAKKLADLRELASGIEHDAVHGYTTMHKEDLVKALCTALGIEAHEHHAAVGIDKTAVKAQIAELKQKRQAALAAGDTQEFKRVLRSIHKLKRKLRSAMV